MRRLGEENEVLRIQVSSSRPHRDQRPRGRGTNSRHNQAATYPRNAKPPPNVRGVWLNEGPLPTYRALLGPQAPGKDRLHKATTHGTYPDPSAVFGAPSALVILKAIINYIHGGPLDEEYNSKRKRQRLLQATSVREHVSSIRLGLTSGSAHIIDGVIIFPPMDPAWVL
ncbi:hypothetical protein CK203_031662 [Vitis vinifera]|uniref:Uncharacterized protein n=1 Tax=Vitis vinifera TaxID=29760 RepID=A0A438I395_VITVI|nr:hypothetical protein CK203_031662 [Vitis vinifera]